MLVDFGLPSCIRENYDSFAVKLFRAPELLGCPRDKVVQTQEGDVYALAMTFYEVTILALLFFDGTTLRH